jgi:hypothetical protein
MVLLYDAFRAAAGVLSTWPLAQALFQPEPSVVAKQPAGTPANAAPAWSHRPSGVVDALTVAVVTICHPSTANNKFREYCESQMAC